MVDKIRLVKKLDPKNVNLKQYLKQENVRRKQVPNLRFGKIALCTDADLDGAHICGLLINIFDKFWPELFKLGVINIFMTPLLKVFVKGKEHAQFFTLKEFEEWESGEGKKLKGWNAKWYKGLATSSDKEFDAYFANMDKHLIRVEVEDQSDLDSIDLAFNGQRAGDRKTWLETPAGNIDDFITEE